MAVKGRATNPDEAKVAEIRDRFSEAFDHWDRLYKDGDKSIRYLVEGPWETEEKQARDAAGLPVVTYDEIGQYLNQACNEVRANPRSPIFNPEGDGANDDTARFYGNYYRQVEYTSNGQVAFTTAYDNALTRGYGFVRMVTEYEHERSHVQRPKIQAIHNPSSCYPDPDGKEPDGGDWKYFFVIESYTKKEFQRAFPKAQFTDFTAEQIQAVGGHWLGQNRCQVAEYWEIEEQEAELIEVEVPATRMKPQRVVSYIPGVDQRPRGAKEIQRRPTTIKTVCQYLTNGVELLPGKSGQKKTPWAGQHLPFAPCYAKIVWMNAGGGPKRELLSMVSLARSPYKSYCFLAACELATVGSITKNPFFAYEGTVDAAQMQEYAKALHEPVAMLLSKPFLQGKPDVLMPLPERNPMSVDLAPIAIAKENARRAIQAAMGWTPLPTDAQKKNDKSGVALRQIETSGQKGAYHFIDHYNDMLRRIGVIFEDLVDKLVDTEREVVTRTADNKSVKYLVNPDPKKTQRMIPEGVEVLPSTKGRHSVIVDVGPEIESEREAAAEFLDSFIGSQLMGALEPAKRDKLIALAIRMRLLGPIGTQMAEVIDPQAEKKDGPDPATLMAALKQAQEQIIPMLEAEIVDRDQKLAAKETEVASRERIAAAADQTKRDIAALASKDKRHQVETQSDTAIDVQAMKNELEALKLRIDVYLASKDREQERNVVGAQLEQGTAMAERGHETMMAEGEKDRMMKSTEGAAERGVKSDIARLSAESKKKASDDAE